MIIDLQEDKYLLHRNYNRNETLRFHQDLSNFPVENVNSVTVAMPYGGSAMHAPPFGGIPM
jgi:hypothetical protein